MKIKREIKIGDFATEIEIELTDKELRRAYNEATLNQDIDDTTYAIEVEMASSSDPREIEIYRKMLDDKSLIEAIATSVRDRIECCDEWNGGNMYLFYEAIRDELESYSDVFNESR